MPGSNSRPNVSEGYEVPTELPGSTGNIAYVILDYKSLLYKKGRCIIIIITTTVLLLLLYIIINLFYYVLKKVFVLLLSGVPVWRLMEKCTA